MDFYSINYTTHNNKPMVVEMIKRILLVKVVLSMLLLTLLGSIPDGDLNAMQIQQDNSRAEFLNVKFAELQQRFYKTEIEKTIKIEIEDETVSEALKYVSRETGLRLTFRGDIMVDKKVSLNQNNISVSDALAYILSDTGLDYKVSNDGYLLISQVEGADESELYQETVSGRVTDSQSQEALPGVNIVVEGTTTGTSTNIDGEFELTVPSLDETLVISYIGYQTQQISINGRSEINIALIPQAISGDELVVVGYGVQRRQDITSSISSVNFEDFENQPVQDITAALQGRVSGVHMAQQSGNPGDSFMIRLRGVGSVNDRDTQPLIVVDGNPMANTRDLDPSQVENIQVLKSASATAIYGARGANGVILITTKSGRAGETLFDLNYYTGISTPRMLEMVNATEYATLYNEASINAGEGPIYDNPEQFGEGTDWQALAYRNAVTRNINMSVSGGNESSTFYLQGGYEQVEGVVRTTWQNRLSVRLNSQHNITDFLRLGQNIGVSWAEFSGSNQYTMGGMLGRNVGRNPTVPVYQPDGSFSDLPIGSNLEASLQRAEDARDRTERPVVTGSAYAELDFLENLTFRSQYNLTYGNQIGRNFSAEYFISTTDNSENSSISRSQAMFRNWNLDNTLTFRDSFFGVHNLTAMAGFTLQENWSENFNASAQTLPAGHETFHGLRYLSMAEENHSVGGGGGGFAMISYLGRINYDYDETYLATINYRIDGSSKFGPENRYGYFPSFSLGWRLSNESFLSDVDWMDNLLVRGGWGRIGNQEPLGNYAYTSTVQTGKIYHFGPGSATSRQWLPGHAPEGAGNPHIQWEAIEETNFGFAFTGFQNSINVEFDWYNKVTTDMLLQLPVATFSGLQSPPFSNGGEVLNRGYEISVGYQRTTPGDLWYNITANMSYNRNELIDLAGPVDNIPGGWISFIGDNYITRATVGQPLGQFYGYVFDGLFQNQAEIDAHASQTNAEPGDIRFRDLNGDGVINSDDQTYIGNPWPSHTFGLNAAFAYKNFDLNLGIQGVYGNDIFAAWKWTMYGGNWFQYHPNALNRWTGENTSNEIPRLHLNDPNDNLRPSSWYVEDGSYIRLNNVQLGYTIPQGIINIRKLRVYATATNVFTITGYNGQDPELGYGDAQGAPLFVGLDTQQYSVPRTFTFGVNIGF